MVLLKMRGIKLIILLTIITISPLLISASDSFKEQQLTISSAYYFPDHKGFELMGDFAPVTYSPISTESESLRNLGSTWGGIELQATYKLSLTDDFLTGGTPLTSGNNIKKRLNFSITPVNFEVGGDITLTPIAFIALNLGSSVASGWEAIGIVGLGLNNSEGFNKDPFQGILSQTWFAGTFQFDTAALLNGDTTWKHIIIQSTHKILYKNFSIAGEDDPWTFQGSEGNNYNGFIYNHTTFLGYQMPLVLNMAGFIVETETNLFDNSQRSTMNSGGWGSDFIKIRLGTLFNFNFNENHSLAILPQITTRPHFTNDTVKNSYFANRKIDTNSPIYFDFERIAFVYNYKF